MPQAVTQNARALEGARVLIVDDHRTFAELLSGALASAGMQPIGTASSAAEAVAMVEQLRPDVVVMDIEMPRQDGLAATRRIREVCPEFPGHPRHIHWSIPDPAAAGDTDEASYPAFQATAAELEFRLGFLLAAIAATPARSAHQEA